jgi:hypothetical protein
VDLLIKSFFGSREKLKEFLEEDSKELMPKLVVETAAPQQLDETLL